MDRAGDTTEREQIVAWLRTQAKACWQQNMDREAMALLKISGHVERGDHLKESPHG